MDGHHITKSGALSSVCCERRWQSLQISEQKLADQMVQWLGKPAAVPEVPGSNPG